MSVLCLFRWVKRDSYLYFDTVGNITCVCTVFRWVKRDSYLYFDTVGNFKCVCTVFVQMGEERQLPIF